MQLLPGPKQMVSITGRRCFMFNKINKHQRVSISVQFKHVQTTHHPHSDHSEANLAFAVGADGAFGEGFGLDHGVGYFGCLHVLQGP